MANNRTFFSLQQLRWAEKPMQGWGHLLTQLEGALLEGKVIRLPGLGVLKLVDVPEHSRMRRNPQTGQMFEKHYPAHRKLVFKPHKNWREVKP